MTALLLTLRGDSAIVDERSAKLFICSASSAYDLQLRMPVFPNRRSECFVWVLRDFGQLGENAGTYRARLSPSRGTHNADTTVVLGFG